MCYKTFSVEGLTFGVHFCYNIDYEILLGAENYVTQNRDF